MTKKPNNLREENKCCKTIKQPKNNQKYRKRKAEKLTNFDTKMIYWNTKRRKIEISPQKTIFYINVILRQSTYPNGS